MVAPPSFLSSFTAVASFDPSLKIRLRAVRDLSVSLGPGCIVAIFGLKIVKRRRGRFGPDTGRLHRADGLEPGDREFEREVQSRRSVFSPDRRVRPRSDFDQ
jgi:hypothetical protein